MGRWDGMEERMECEGEGEGGTDIDAVWNGMGLMLVG